MTAAGGTLGRGAWATLDVQSYTPHAAHAETRIWTETNCYADIWIEILAGLGHNPMPAFASAFATNFLGDQWSFLKPLPHDVLTLYGLTIEEITLWRPLLEHTASVLERGDLLTVEVDSFWLPDTAATEYRSGHVKTTIVPTAIDTSGRRLSYLHNAGLYSLQGEDFDAIFGPDPRSIAPMPYTELIRQTQPGDREALLRVCATHLRARPTGSPIAALGTAVAAALPRFSEATAATFHLWAFANLRQCGAAAEIAADIADVLATRGIVDTTPATQLRQVAQGAKAVQFRCARALRGRTVDVSDVFADMSTAWDAALATLAEGVLDSALV